MKINIGLKDTQRKPVIDILNQLLANGEANALFSVEANLRFKLSCRSAVARAKRWRGCCARIWVRPEYGEDS